MSITGAHLILHVIDASSSEREGQRDAVDETLEQIGAQSIPRIEVFNKCDLLSEEDASALKSRYPQAIAISAATGEGLRSSSNESRKPLQLPIHI